MPGWSKPSSLGGLQGHIPCQGWLVWLPARYLLTLVVAGFIVIQSDFFGNFWMLHGCRRKLVKPQHVILVLFRWWTEQAVSNVESNQLVLHDTFHYERVSIHWHCVTVTHIGRWFNPSYASSTGWVSWSTAQRNTAVSVWAMHFCVHLIERVQKTVPLTVVHICAVKPWKG